MFRTFSSPSQSLRSPVPEFRYTPPPDRGDWRDTASGVSGVQQHIRIKATAMLISFSLAEGHAVVATSAPRRREVFRVPHSSFAASGSNQLSFGPWLGPLHGGQSLLFGTRSCSNSSIPIYRRPDWRQRRRLSRCCKRVRTIAFGCVSSQSVVAGW